MKKINNLNIFAKSLCVRSSPQKLRLISKILKNIKVNKALNYLYFISKKSAFLIRKVVNSAISNAKHNYNINIDNIIISSVIIDDGPSFKRIIPRAKGRMNYITKRTSHITVNISYLNNNKIRE